MITHSVPCGHAASKTAPAGAARVPVARAAVTPKRPAGGNQGRHGPLRVPLHPAPPRQGPGVDPGARPRRARPPRLRGAPLLSDAPPDAGGNALLKEIETLIARFPPYSEEREQFSAALYGTSEVLKIDGEGRAILTEPLKSHAGIKDEIAFAGLGHKFQIWEPGRFRAE